MIPWTIPQPSRRFEARKRVQEALESMSLDELVEQRVEEVYRADEISHPALRRFYQNTAVVYARDELTRVTRAGLVALLRS